MISINYDSHIAVGQKIKLSAIVDADSFVYGIFDQDMNLASVGNIPYSDCDVFLSGLERSHKLIEKKICSASDLFIHVPIEDLPEQTQNSKIEKLYDEEIAIVYDVKYHSKFDTVHMSTLFNRYYFGKLGQVVHLHLKFGVLYIYAVEDGKMQFYNQFDIENEADLAYFTNLVFQTLKWDVEKVKIAISGMIDPKSNLHNTLSIYFSELKYFDKEDFHITQDAKYKKSYYFDHYINMYFG